MDKAQLKQFAKEIMEEMNISGGKISKLIQLIAPKYNLNKQKIKLQLKRALIDQYE